MDAAEPLRLVDDLIEPSEQPRAMWHITLTVAGAHVPELVIKGALERLSHEHPFLLSGRYSADRAEVRYWEEATDVATAPPDAVAAGMRFTFAVGASPADAEAMAGRMVALARAVNGDVD